MRLNENYTFEGAADCCGQDLASVRCVSSLQNCPGTGFKSFRWGRERESIAYSVCEGVLGPHFENENK
ncbi:hypothetical protein TNCV_1418301 [Trichonephila clavipes]|nr:hypothetical protein TNCV_1418301 [Trichonephila clavipes]